MEMLQNNINIALRELFDYKTDDIYPNTINFIQIEMLKDAFRKKAKMYHPDRSTILGKSESELNEKFKNLNNNYQFLLTMLKENIKPANNFEENIYPHKEKKPVYKKNEESNKKTKIDNFFYSGVLPKRKLRFAEYLYYCKIIDWQTMIKALVWQFQSRPRIGEIGISTSYLDKDTIIQILRNSKLNERFGEAALRMGKLTNYQLYVLLGKQKHFGIQIGKFFISAKILTRFQVENYLLENQIYNLKY
jgi:hypothetical protein